MTLEEIITQLDIMARCVYGDDAWIGMNKVTGCTVWYNSRDVAVSGVTIAAAKEFLISQNQINQQRFNDALKKIGG